MYTLTLSAQQASKCSVTVTSGDHDHGHDHDNGHRYDYDHGFGFGFGSCDHDHDCDCDFGAGGDDGRGFDCEKTIASCSFRTRDEFEMKMCCSGCSLSVGYAIATPNNQMQGPCGLAL